MSTIQSLDLQFTGEFDQLEKALGKIDKKVSEFSKGATPNFKPFQDAIDSNAKKIDSLSDRLTSAAGATRGFALDLKGLAIAAVGVGAALLAKSGLDRIDQLGDTAQQIGVTTSALSELRHAANLTGSSAEDLDAALLKLNQNLGDAALKANPTSDALARLGLDAKKLAGLSLDEAFRKVVAGFEKIPSASEKASLAMDIFGKGGVNILNTLGAGAGQLDKLSREAREFGLSISGIDAANIGATKDALDRASLAIEGAANQLTIKLAPAIAFAADEFTKFTGGIAVGSEKSGLSIGMLGDAFVTIADVWTDVGVGFSKVSNAITGGIGSVVEYAGGVAAEFAALWVGPKAANNSFLGDFQKFGRGMKDEADKVGKDIEKSIVAPTAGEKIAQKFKKLRDDMNAAAAGGGGPGQPGGTGTSDALGKSIGDVTGKLNEQIATFGKSAAEIELYKLKQAGATAEQLEAVEVLARQRDALDANRKAADDAAAAIKKGDDEMKSFAAQLKAKVQSPFEKLADEMKKIQDALNKGLITPEQAAMGGVAAQKDFAEGGKPEGGSEGPKFAGALERGSAEARSAILTASNGGKSGPDKVASNTTRLVQQNDELIRFQRQGFERARQAPAVFNIA